MREEMENLASGESRDEARTTIKSKSDVLISSATNNTSSSSEYVEDLKRQLLDAKQKNRSLQAQIDEILLNKNKLPHTITDNTIINSHIKSINETVGE